MTDAAANFREDWFSAMEMSGGRGRASGVLEVLEKVKGRIDEGAIVHPKESEIFAAFEFFQPDRTKVVLLGQDPYHGAGQAHGLCFSVRKGVPAPPSLRNIFKEIEQEFGAAPMSTDLTFWAKQGVLLLNSVLTVEDGAPGSHAKFEWEAVSDQAIRAASRLAPSCVFMLWGGFAGKKAQLIDTGRHLILQSPHPSPLSAYRGFLGNGHFKAANDFLKNKGIEPVDWIGASRVE